MFRYLPFVTALLVSPAYAVIDWSVYGEHQWSRFDETSENVDSHKLTLALDTEITTNWHFNLALSYENGWNERYPGDGFNTDTSEFIAESLNVTWQYAEHHQLTVGRFYLPIGIVNKADGQFAAMGVNRNPVEINIIPTNWVETGLMASGLITDNLSYDFSIHSALIMEDAGLVRDGRNSDSFSVSKAHAFTARLGYQPWDALSWFTSFHFEVDTTDWEGWGNNSAGLIQSHLIYETGSFRHTAFYAYWDIDGIRYEWSGREKQNGWYFESVYRVSEAWSTFIRLNEWDNEQDNNIPSRVRQLDLGFNYAVGNDLILKADVSKFYKSQEGHGINLGLTWRL